MALSMDEQRMLAEIERRLSAEDPGLAARLSSFRRPGPRARLRTPRGRILGSLVTIAMVAVISLTVYAMAPFRSHSPKSTLTPQASTSAPAHFASAAANTSATAGAATPAARAGSHSTAGKSAVTTSAGTKNTAAATASAG